MEIGNLKGHSRNLTDAEGLAASALLRDVGVLENESPGELILNPVHLAAEDVDKSLGVDQDLDAVLLNGIIKLARLVDVFEVVCQAGAALALGSNANQLGLRRVQKLT